MTDECTRGQFLDLSSAHACDRDPAERGEPILTPALVTTWCSQARVMTPSAACWARRRRCYGGRRSQSPLGEGHRIVMAATSRVMDAKSRAAVET
jgi:hypothetical protein